MAFISFEFYIFLATVVALYYLIPLKYRWITLLAGSMVFYWFVSEYSIGKFLMLVAGGGFCWFFGNLISKDEKRKKLWLVASILIIAFPLFVIKESTFIFPMITRKSIPSWWLVPVGIAFYSMQLIAYVVDIYKGQTVPEKNPFKFLLFVSFFPQIIQGPIPRHNQLAHQLTEGHCFDEKRFVKGFMLILWGFFLKLCIADKAGIFVDSVFNNNQAYRGMYVLVAGILYSFQLYADFSACTSFAQGTAGLFGIDIINNFNHPYFSVSIKDFWRRWHISLSSWLRDYIYIPLGGNRKGRIRKYLNLLITFAISGMWHGAGYKFLFWGLLHGIYQIMGELLRPVKDYLDRKLYLESHLIFKNVIKTIATFFMVTFAWIIFRADSLKSGLLMVKSIFTVHNTWILTNDALFELGLSWKECMVLLFCLLILMIVSWHQEKGIQIREKILSCNLFTRWCIYIGLIIFVIIFGTYGYGFDTQAFIYGGF